MKPHNVTIWLRWWRRNASVIAQFQPACLTLRDLEQSWEYFRRTDLHEISAVDATSFAIMKRARIRVAFAFDHHFAVVGFRLVT